MKPFLLVMLLTFTFVLSNAVFYIQEKNCAKPLEVGANIHSQIAVASNLKPVVIKRGEAVLNNGDFYVPGEILSASIFEPTPDIQFILQITNGNFIGDRNIGCLSTRLHDTQDAAFQTPPGGSSDIIIIAGWAEKFGTVYVTDKFALIEQKIITDVDKTNSYHNTFLINENDVMPKTQDSLLDIKNLTVE